MSNQKLENGIQNSTTAAVGSLQHSNHTSEPDIITIKKKPGGQKLTCQEQLSGMIRVNIALMDANAEMADTINKQRQAIDRLVSRLRCYENENTPSYARMIQPEPRERNKTKTDKPNKGKRLPGGQKNHEGKSRVYEPTEIIPHYLEEDEKICPICDIEMKVDIAKRYIIEVPRVPYFEELHHIERAKCKCGHEVFAENNLPKDGNLGKNLVGIIALLRGQHMTFDKMRYTLKQTYGLVLSKSTIINTIARTSDCLETPADNILSGIKASGEAYVDETPIKHDGYNAYVWALVSGYLNYLKYADTRARSVIDELLDGYEGLLITDGYPAYSHFNPDMHQQCWAHKSRTLHGLLERPYYSPEDDLDARKLLCDSIMRLFRAGKKIVSEGKRSRANRLKLERRMTKVLAKFDLDTMTDVDLKRNIKTLSKMKRELFTFVEYDVEPTSNLVERAIKYPVLHRKNSGQIKGGPKTMKRMSNFMSCMMTWKAQGKSILDEIEKWICPRRHNPAYDSRRQVL